jgi:hypothetical protein
MSLMMLLAECIHLEGMRHRLEEGMSFTSGHVCTYDDLHEYRHLRALPHGIDTWIVCRTHVCKERRHERRSGARAHCTSGSPRRTCKQPSKSKARRPFLPQTTKQPCVGGVQKCKYVVPPVAEYLHVGEGEDKRRQRRGKAAACLLGCQKVTVLWINKLVCTRRAEAVLLLAK